MNEKEYKKLLKQVETDDKNACLSIEEINGVMSELPIILFERNYSKGTKVCSDLTKMFEKLQEKDIKYSENKKLLEKEMKPRKKTIDWYLDKIFDANKMEKFDSKIFSKYVDEHFGYYTAFEFSFEEPEINLCTMFVELKTDTLIQMQWDNKKTVKENFKRFLNSCDEIIESANKSKYRITRVEIEDYEN